MNEDNKHSPFWKAFYSTFYELEDKKARTHALQVSSPFFLSAASESFYLFFRYPAKEAIYTP